MCHGRPTFYAFWFRRSLLCKFTFLSENCDSGFLWVISFVHPFQDLFLIVGCFGILRGESRKGLKKFGFFFKSCDSFCVSFRFSLSLFLFLGFRFYFIRELLKSVFNL